MHLADRFGFHLVTTIMAVYDVLPLEGAPPLDPNAIQYTGNLIRYVLEIYPFDHQS